MDLVLGVLDIAYSGQGGTTTGEVANYLERKYEVMGRFYALHQESIGKALSRSVADAITSITAGAPTSLDPFADGMDDIKAEFQTFLEREELAGVAPGVPTKAAVLGKSKRFARRRGPRRPSFIDSGQFAASFKAWIEGEPNRSTGVIPQTESATA